MDKFLFDTELSLRHQTSSAQIQLALEQARALLLKVQSPKLSNVANWISVGWIVVAMSAERQLAPQKPWRVGCPLLRKSSRAARLGRMSGEGRDGW